MRHALVALFAVAIGGCGSNPCEGHGDRCVNALIEGYSGALDQLRISIDQPSATSTTTPNPPSAFTLPVKVALVLPASGAVNVAIEGLSSGTVVATAGPQTVNVPSTVPVTFDLAGGSFDMSAPPADLLPGVVISPAPYHITATRISKSMQRFTMTNNTSAPVQATAMLTGNPVFVIDADNCMGNLIPAGGNCDIEVTFEPTKSASGLATTLSIGGATAAITGDATPVWSAETVPASYNVTGIVGDASGHYFVSAAPATSGDPAQVFTSTGDGTWTIISPAFTNSDNLTSVARYGAGVTLAGSMSSCWITQAGWAQEPVPSSDAGTGVAALYANPDAGFGVGHAGIFRIVGINWVMTGPGQGDGGAANMNAITSDGYHGLFAVGANSLGYAGDTSGTWSTAITLTPAGSPVSMNGVWMPAGGMPNKVWAVGDGAGTIRPGGTIVVVDRATNTPTVEDTSAFPAGTNFRAIHGSVAGGVTRIYAIGNFNGIAYSTGNGTWTLQSAPGVGTLDRALWVSDDGVDIFVVGNVGNISHYY